MILKRLGYEWSFWEILKQKPRQIKNLQKIWDLHKTRNSLVHDLEKKSPSLKKEVSDYEKEIKKILWIKK